MGRMSSNKMPGEGKSGNWRSAACSFILRLESSAELEAAEVESLPWEPSVCSVGGIEVVAEWSRS